MIYFFQLHYMRCQIHRVGKQCNARRRGEKNMSRPCTPTNWSVHVLLRKTPLQILLLLSVVSPPSALCTSATQQSSLLSMGSLDAVVGTGLLTGLVEASAAKRASAALEGLGHQPIERPMERRMLHDTPAKCNDNSPAGLVETMFVCRIILYMQHVLITMIQFITGEDENY